MRLELLRSRPARIIRQEAASSSLLAAAAVAHPPDRRPGVLLLTSGLGLGHVRAAQAIDAALQGKAQVHTVDLWSLMNDGVARAIHTVYLNLVQNHPQLYERLYHLDERSWRQVLISEAGAPPAVLEVLELISASTNREETLVPHGGHYASDKFLLSLLCASLTYNSDSLAGNGVRARKVLMKFTWHRLIRRLQALINRCNPQVIISTQMIPAAMTSYLRQQGDICAPMIGVMTDYGVHDFWRQPGIDHYCLAHPDILAQQTQLPAGCVHASGVPLMPGFVIPLSQAEARSQLNLSQDDSIVLVLGGGLGLSVDAVAGSLLRQPGKHRVLVLPGRNREACEVLAVLARQYPERLRVDAWTDRMDWYLRAADVVVGKPGGITVAESLACGRPLLATRSLGGQEGFNVNFLETHGVGALVSDDELPTRVQGLLADRDALVSMQQRAWQLGCRNGAAEVAGLAVRLAMAQERRVRAT